MNPKRPIDVEQVQQEEWRSNYAPVTVEYDPTLPTDYDGRPKWQRDMPEPTTLDPERPMFWDHPKIQHILQTMSPDEPIFLFRAKDILSSFALETYLTLLEKFNPSGPQTVSCVEAINEFRSWQQTNPDKVKLPD